VSFRCKETERDGRITDCDSVGEDFVHGIAAQRCNQDDRAQDSEDVDDE